MISVVLRTPLQIQICDFLFPFAKPVLPVPIFIATCCSRQTLIHVHSYPEPELVLRQRGRVVSASDLQSGGPGFESRSGHLLDLLSVVPSSNPRPRL